MKKWEDKEMKKLKWNKIKNWENKKWKLKKRENEIMTKRPNMRKCENAKRRKREKNKKMREWKIKQ